MNAHATNATVELDSAPGKDESKSFITTTDLFTAQLAANSPRAVAAGPRLLRVAGVVVAEIGPDPSRLNPMCATSAEGMPVVEVLAAIAAQDPTGVLVIETADLSEGFSFEVVGGKVTGARGPGDLGQLERWCAEVHRCYPDRFNSGGRHDPLWVEVARAFVRERVLDHLELALSPGARLTFLRGDAHWRGTRLPEGKGIALHHLLLEHARRWDEQPRVLAQLGPLDQLAVPMSEPAQTPTKPPVKAAADGWDFFTDPDPAALEEWKDAQLVWPLCDGQHSLAEIVDLALLGRFRGLAALATLTARNHIVRVEGLPACSLTLDEELFEAEVVEEEEEGPLPIDNVVVQLRPPPPPAAPEVTPLDTEYSVVLRKPRRRRATPPPLPQSTPSAEMRTREFRREITPPPIRPPMLKPPPRTESADVIDEMLAEVEVEPPPPLQPSHAPVEANETSRNNAKTIIAMVAAGAALFVAGAAVANFFY